MLWARRRGVFKREYDLTSPHEMVTSLTGRRRESCRFILYGTEYRIERDGRKRFLLHGPYGRLGIAECQTAREWTVHADNGYLSLVKPSMFQSGWEVQLHGATRGEIRQDGAFKKTFTVDIPADVPLPVAVFAFHVVLVLFERSAAASSAG